MRILFLYISLPHLSMSSVFTDLIREFSLQGHDVKVATPLRDKGDEGIRKEAGIEVLRFRTDQLANNKSNIQKGIAYLKLACQFPNAVKKYFKNDKFDLIVAASLPPEMGFVLNRLKKKYKSKVYLMLCEYIWQDAVSLGFFKESSMICRYYKYLEKKTIFAADYIGCPSKGNIEFALGYYPWAKEKNIHVLHYTQAPFEIKQDNDIRKKFNLEGKFVVIYGGNMSIVQKMKNVIDLAQACMEYEDIVFLLIGRGQDVIGAKVETEKRNITNIQFVDFMAQKEYLQLLSTCDVGLVSLNEKLAMPNIPSKTLAYFSLSIPVVASVDKATDYGAYLDAAGAGLWSYAGDAGAYKDNLLKLYNDRDLKRKMGSNGFEFYNENMLPIRGYETIMGIVLDKKTN